MFMALEYFKVIDWSKVIILLLFHLQDHSMTIVYLEMGKYIRKGMVNLDAIIFIQITLDAAERFTTIILPKNFVKISMEHSQSSEAKKRIRLC